MSDVHGGSKRYEYSSYPKLATYFLGPVLLALCIGLAIILFKQGALDAFIMFILFAIGLALLIALLFLRYGSIGIDEEGIAAYQLGWRMKAIRWGDVKKVQKMRVWATYGYSDSFYIYDGEFGPWQRVMVNLRGPISFSDELRESRDLLDRINGYAQEYGFPLVTLDQEAASKMAARNGAGYLKRVAPKVDEVKVTKF